MKSALATISIIGFISVAVFGFVGIGHISEAAHYGCLAALSQNGICPSTSAAPLEAAFSHLNILRSFSTALLTNILILLVLAFTALYGLKNSLSDQDTGGMREISFYAKKNDFIDNNFLNSSLSWLNLHQNSPAFAKSA